MPAMLEDPTAPVLYRVSGVMPYPTPHENQLPPTIVPRQVTLRDRVTIASLIPFRSLHQVPPHLLAYLCDQLNREIIKGDTYPMINPLPLETFGPYWFQNFGAVMLLGEVNSVEEVQQMESQGTDWTTICLGSFYIKPNYPGRSSHVCNGGFLVTDAARNKGVGRLMGEGYLEWAPQLGYTYSVFNLVYETNVASCRIWDALGFKRIGRVKGCGNLASHPDELIDAIIYGRDLGPEGEDFVSEERFDKIRYYLKHGKYPNGADRAEKSRLRSAATHYKLLPAEDGSDTERLMLKDKEVVADPQRQYEIARQVHAIAHGGINKTTATIAEKYHWVRIKETVSLVIKNCPDCKEIGKTPALRSEGSIPMRKSNGNNSATQDPNSGIERLVSFEDHPNTRSSKRIAQNQSRTPGSSPPQEQQQQQLQKQQQQHNQQQERLRAPIAPMQSHPHSHSLSHNTHNPHQQMYDDMPLDPRLDPQIMGGGPMDDGPHVNTVHVNPHMAQVINVAHVRGMANYAVPGGVDFGMDLEDGEGDHDATMGDEVGVDGGG